MPEFREVRQNASTAIHRTYDGDVGRPATLCGMTLQFTVRDPREWRGSPTRTIVECTECFEWVDDSPEDTEPEQPVPLTWTPAPGDFVTVTDGEHDGLRGWTPTTVYVYVGPPGNDVTSSYATLVVPTGWEWGPHRSLSPLALDANIHQIPGVRFWNVQADSLVPALGMGLNEAQTIARARLQHHVTTTANPVQECTIPEHPEWEHTHTVGSNLSGDPNADSDGFIREVHPVTGDYVLFAKGEHLIPNSDSLESTTTERESTMPPTYDVPGDIGDDIHPLTAAKLRGLPNGSILTIRSRDRGELRGSSVHFGCQEWTLDALQRAAATIEFQQPHSRIVATCDVPVTTQGDLVIAGRRIVLSDVNDYARTITIKELGTLDPPNALVMEHGFYGCLHHRGEILILGMGRPRPHGTAQVPLLGRLRQHGAPDAAYGGTIGVPIGLLHASSTQCTPAWPVTGAFTMMFATERRFSAVPASPAQIERADDRFEVTTIAGRDIVMCDERGVVEAPALADMPF